MDDRRSIMLVNTGALPFSAVAIALISSSLLAQPASGPFGLHRGMTKEEVIQIVGKDAVKEVKGDRLKLRTVPKPHRAFEFYSLSFSPKDGLLQIIGVGNDIRTNGFGESVHDSFMEMRDAISNTYGQPEFNLDYLKQGSIWRESEDWMIGLVKKERELSAAWSKHLPSRIRGIVLEAKGLSAERGFLELTYEFDGWDEYVDSLKNKENSVF
jgi:hypothetical protein